MKRIISIVLIMVIMLNSSACGSFSTDDPFGFTKVDIEKVKDSVVMIETYDDSKSLIATGSGFCAYNENWIITNFHVIEGARHISVITDDGQTLDALAITLFNKKEDLAILEINGELTPLTLGDGTKLRVKDKVTAIGSPMGERNTVSEGIISNADSNREIRISAAISHGSSGGVLLDKKHHVIGITNAGYDNAQNLNFAINICVLEEMVESYKNREYDFLTSFNYASWIPSITEFNTNNSLNILEKCSVVDAPAFNPSFPNLKTGPFFNISSENLDAFYKATNQYQIFEYEMNKLVIDDNFKIESNSFRDRYNAFTEDDKKQAADNYMYLLQFESRTEDDPAYSALLGNIPDWTFQEFIMEMDILRTYELAIMLVEIEDLLENETLVAYLNESTLDYEDCIILYRLFNKADDRYNGEIIEIFNADDRITYEQEIELLEYLGMSVDEYGNVSW